MPETARRSRPTLRCTTDDLNLALPPLDIDLGALDHPALREVRRLAPASPVGQKRILAIDHPLVYRIRVGGDRGATWVDDERDVVWLCALRRRQAGSDDDAFVWFAELHQAGRLLPSDDDALRDRAEAIIRLQRGLADELLRLIAAARLSPALDSNAILGNWLPARVHVRTGDGIDEVWCALAVQGIDGAGVPERLRDVLFAGLESALAPVVSEVRADWPTGEVTWAEVVRLYVADGD